MTGGNVSRPKPHYDDIKQRLCLKCRKEFTSLWAGNRVCRKCASSERRVYGVEACFVLNVNSKH